MLAAPKTTIIKKQYMLNIEEKKNRETSQKNGKRKMERECTTNHMQASWTKHGNVCLNEKSCIANGARQSTRTLFCSILGFGVC